MFQKANSISENTFDEIHQPMTYDATSSVTQFFSTDTPAEHAKDEADQSFSKLINLVKSFNNTELEEFFQLEDTVQWIMENGYKRIALQLADHFLPRACRIAKFIESKADVKTFVLADTSYRSCCVDEVAAAHASCDAIIHYGDACLSALTENIPVKFIFGCFPVNLSAFEGIEAYLNPSNDIDVLLLTDACYSNDSDKLEGIIERFIPSGRLFHAVVINPSGENACLDDANSVSALGRHLPRQFCETSSVLVCFVGDPASPLVPLWLMTYPQCTSLLIFDPQTSTFEEQTPQSLRQLRKRLFLIEKLRDASTVGLVVGSVGVRGHIEAVQRVRKLCKAARKRLYVISVGKVNVPKLSNFADIDVFVLLSCPFGVILDSSDFFRPVLSMFEAEIALNPAKTWSGHQEWSGDFTTFADDVVGFTGEESVDMSLLTGRIRAEHVDASGDEKNGGQILPYEKGNYFKFRTWRGLDADVRLDESTKVKLGRTGTALGYDTEPIAHGDSSK